MPVQLLKDGFNTVVDEISSGFNISNPFTQSNLEKGAPKKFPKDLDSKEFGGLKIEFQVWENKGIRLLEGAGATISGGLDSFSQSGISNMVKDAVSNKDTSKIGQIASAAKGVVDGIVNKIGKVFQSTASTVQDTAKEVWKRDIATSESNSIAITQTNLTHCGTWQLFIPQSISTSYNASWAKTELGFLGNVLETAFKRVPSQAVNAAKLLNREITNPQSELLFEGIDHRTFSYTFGLFPKNEEESILIQELIKFFKSNMTPMIAPNTATLVLRYPNYFKIRYLKGGEDNPYINKVAYCVLESFDVSYKDASSSFHRDGSPSMVNISMRFREVEPIFRQMICQGY